MTPDKKAAAERIAVRIRELRFDRPPPRGEAAEALAKQFTTEKIAEIIAEFPPDIREWFLASITPPPVKIIHRKPKRRQ
jgi:hypothetical protein